MKNPWQKLIVVFSLILILTLTVFVQIQSENKISTEKEIKADLELVPCEDGERLESVKNLFKKMGAKDEDLVVEKFEDVENLVLTTKGGSEEKIVIGAHYDKTNSGCGAIDNWTGIVLLANLYKTTKNLKTNKTYKFVAFGKEEKGLVGSKAMADAIPKEERENYCAMVNFDSFGFSYPQALGNASDKKLKKLAKETSKKLNFPFSDVDFIGADADSSSFKKVNIPALTLHGLTDNWQDFLHKNKDKAENVNAGSVYVGYRYALLLINQIDKSDCDAFR